MLSKGSLSGDDIANQCAFDSRMAAAGIIAMLRRQKAIATSLPGHESGITDVGKNILNQPKEPETRAPIHGDTTCLEPKTEPEVKKKRKAKAEQGQGANPDPSRG